LTIVNLFPIPLARRNGIGIKNSAQFDVKKKLPQPPEFCQRQIVACRRLWNPELRFSRASVHHATSRVLMPLSQTSSYRSAKNIKQSYFSSLGYEWNDIMKDVEKTLESDDEITITH
jgi:hypothetical protein